MYKVQRVESRKLRVEPMNSSHPKSFGLFRITGQEVLVRSITVVSIVMSVPVGENHPSQARTGLSSQIDWAREPLQRQTLLPTSPSTPDLCPSCRFSRGSPSPHVLETVVESCDTQERRWSVFSNLKELRTIRPLQEGSRLDFQSNSTNVTRSQSVSF